MIKKLFLAIITVCLSLSFSTNSVAALEPGDIVMSVTPSEQDLELKVGETYHGSITVLNLGRLGFEVHASVAPFQIASDEYVPDYTTENTYTRLANWIKLEKTTYHINPGEKVAVNFTIDVPDGVAASGQYAAIMLQSDSGMKEENSVNVNTRVAAVLYGHVQGAETRAEGELVEHSLPSFMFNDKFQVSQTVRNTGNIDFKVEQKVTITNFFTGQAVITPESISDSGENLGHNIAAVLPGTSRTGIITWKDAPKLGVFRITQSINFLNQEYEFSQVVVICPMWLLVLIIGFIIALIIYLILKIKSNKRAEAEPDLF